MHSSDVWIHLKNGIDENERPRRIVFILSYWNFVNETRLTENFATPIIPLVTFHFNQFLLLRILTSENQEPSTLASTLARKKDDLLLRSSLIIPSIRG